MTELKIYGDHDERTVSQMWRCMGVGSVAGGVLCADGHLGYAQPVGGVIAYEDHVSISGVGFDIGCGNMAARINLKYEDIKDARAGDRQRHQQGDQLRPGPHQPEADRPRGVRFAAVGTTPAPAISSRWRARSSAPSAPATTTSTCSKTKRATCGSACTSARAASATRARRTTSSSPAARTASTSRRRSSTVESELGQRYLAAMTLAGEYAYAGREWVVETVRRILCAKATDTVHNHHNYAWRERHGERDLWVVRKGATPAFPGQRGFVGGSMGDNAVILSGVESEEGAQEPVLDRARRRPRDVAHRGQGQAQPQDRRGAARGPRQPRRDAGVAAREGRASGRRRPRRGAAGLPPAARRARRNTRARSRSSTRCVRSSS